MTIPGLKIVAPSTPYDIKGLIKSAIREDNPVQVLYHVMLVISGIRYMIPDEEYSIPLGKADIKREGSDVTVVAVGFMVHRALAAADKLQEKGISLEIVDLRSLAPIDKLTIFSSLEKTGRLVIMDEEPKTESASSEIAAIVAEEAFDLLNAPIKRVCAPDTPIPFSPTLEKAWMPDRLASWPVVSEYGGGHVVEHQAYTTAVEVLECARQPFKQRELALVSIGMHPELAGGAQQSSKQVYGDELPGDRDAVG